MLADSTAQDPLPGPTQHSCPSETSTSTAKTQGHRLRKTHTTERIPDSSDLKTKLLVKALQSQIIAVTPRPTLLVVRVPTLDTLTRLDSQSRGQEHVPGLQFHSLPSRVGAPVGNNPPLHVHLSFTSMFLSRPLSLAPSLSL